MATIPRFLLPRRGAIWTRPAKTSMTSASLARWSAASPRCAAGCLARARPASTSSRQTAPPPSAPHILEKPAKFNPPSHGSRLPRKGARPTPPPSMHYGGDLSASERQAQRLRQYPGMASPPGTWSHWFWNSRALHMGITMTALTLLAAYTFLENFKHTSPYVDMLPTAREALRHPILALRTTVEVVRLTEERRVAEISEKRQRRVDDVAKRTLYRKAHGLEETVGFNSGWLSGGVKKEGPTPPARNEEADLSTTAATAVTAVTAVDDASPVRQPDSQPASEEGKPKRFGIF